MSGNIACRKLFRTLGSRSLEKHRYLHKQQSTGMIGFLDPPRVLLPAKLHLQLDDPLFPKGNKQVDSETPG